VTDSDSPEAHAGPRTVLVLGGGGMKGTAHVGVCRALDEVGIRPDAIVGTSIGALIGCALAGGMGWRDLAEMALSLTKDDIVDVNRRAVFMGGVREEAVFHADRYRAWIERSLPLERFADASPPVRVNAVSLVTCEEVWFGTGVDEEIAPAEAVYASCAIPIYFPPLRRNGDLLVDGGILNVVPVDRAFAWGAERVIAVDVGSEIQPPPERYFDRGMIAIHDRVLTMNIDGQRRRNLEAWRDRPVTLIRPRIGHLGTWDFDRSRYFLEEGYHSAMDALRAAGVA
jgi:NTE family protein